MPPVFCVNDLVEWTSQSHGSTKTKRGIVYRIVPAGQHPISCLRDEDRAKIDFSSFDGSGSSRSIESYLVLVHPPKASRRKPTLYWPKVAYLAKA